MLRYWLLKSFAIVLSFLPPWLCAVFARGLAFLAIDVLRVRRRVINRGLDFAFGPELTPERRYALTKESAYSFALTVIELLRAVRLPLGHDVTFTNRDVVDTALASGKGCFIMVCHIGNWEVFAAQVSQQIKQVHVPVKKVGSAGVNRLVEEIRHKHNFLTVPRTKKGEAYRAILGGLKRGEIIGFMMDQSRPGEPRIPFFGEPAKTNTSLATMWLRLQVPVIPGTIKRVGIFKHEVSFYPPLELEKTGDDAQDVLRIAERCNKAIEQVIRDNPEQYFWFHNRWK